MATTTIQLSTELKRRLDALKLHPRETYGDVLERILEDLRELNAETKRDIERAIKEIEAGKFRTQEQVKAEMGF
jgi:predicted transcriptional regulator